MALFLGVAATMVYRSTANASGASTAAASQAAFSLAEAGLNDGVSVVFSHPTSTALPGAASPATDTTSRPGSTVSYWGTWDSSSSRWTVYGRGTVPAPASAGVLTRTVSQQVKLGSGRALLADNSAWGYIFADNRNGPCATLASSVHINVPMYVTGNLCLDSSAQVQQSASPVTVEGSLQTNSAASLGTSAAHLSQLHVGVGCRYGTVGSFTFPCTTGEHVWVDSQDQAVGTATKPPVDLPYWYQNAMPGPAAYCTSGTFPAAFDNDGTLNGSVGTVNFLTSTPYDCVVDSGGTTVGEIRWTPGNPASLYINGVVFIDGNISMSNSYKIDYTGLGTIYASGSIYLGGSLQLCGARNGGSCDWTTGAWDPEQTLLAWVAGTTLELDSSVQLQGALYATTDYTQTSSVHEQGPVVTTNLYFQSSAQTRWLPFVHLAPGMPQRASFGGATLVPGTWNG